MTVTELPPLLARRMPAGRTPTAGRPPGAAAHPAGSARSGAELALRVVAPDEVAEEEWEGRAAVAAPDVVAPSRTTRVVDAIVERRVPARLVFVATTLVVCAALFGLVAFHVLLTQGQFRLQRLEARTADEQAAYDRLRLQVAQLESPARIVAAAQERLGMVPPAGIKYLSAVGVTADPSPSPPALPPRPAPRP